MTGVQIRLRTSEDGSATAVLGTVPFDQLDGVIPTLKAWGLIYDGMDVSDLTGQFVLGDAAYFEVVVNLDDE